MTKTIKKNMYLLILVAISITVIAVSFAYFVAQISSPANTEVSVGTEVSEKLIFTPSDALSINANQENFAEGNGSVSDSTTSSATIIANSSIGSASGIYQVYLDINSNNFVYTVNEATPELILTVTNPEGNEVTTIDGLSYKTVTDASTGETILGFDITTFEGLIKIKEDEAISTTNSSVGTTENWTIKVTFVNLNSDQVLNEGKILESNFILQEQKIIYLNEHIINLHSSIDGTNDLYYTNNAEYRYSGPTPDNYIWFNNELWRIIGIFDENSHGVEGNNLIKITRNEFLHHDKSNSVNFGGEHWSISSMKTILNDYYYNSLNANDSGLCIDGLNHDPITLCDYNNNGINENSRKLIEKTNWYLGVNDTYTQNSGEYYLDERGNLTFDSYPLIDTSNIGLLYPSDYGYASNQECWNIDLYPYNETCVNSNWMATSTELVQLISNTMYDSTPLFSMIQDKGEAVGVSNSSYNAIRPTLYLNQKVTISGGTGSETDPYLLSMQ